MISAVPSSMMSLTGLQRKSSNPFSSYTQPPFGVEAAASVTDQVQISGAGLQKYERMRLIDTFSPVYQTDSPRKTKTLAEVGQDFQADFAGYRDLLGGFLRMAGIDLSEPLTLQPDLKGRINVVGDHPEADTVNQMFDKNSPLVSRFMVMAARASILDAAETEPGFRRDYEEDAVGAIRNHIDALADRLGGFQLQVGQDGFDFDFA